MRLPRRGILLVAILAAIAGRPVDSRSEEVAMERDFSTVGRIVARLVDGRTIIVVPVSGPLRAHLSEPVRVGNHWRLYVTIEDARMSIRGTGVKNPEGVVGLTAAEVGNDVRLTVDVRELGDYGARHSEEGYLLWLDPKRKPVLTAGLEPLGSLQSAAASRPEPQKQPRRRSGSSGSLFLIVLAAGAGLAVRQVRRNGLPGWAEGMARRIPDGLREKLFGPAPTKTGGQGVGKAGRGRVVPGADPRGRSAEIGDAFRIEPETPPSGIAALGSATGTNDK